MTGDLILAWDDRTNSMQPIGVVVFDGKHFTTEQGGTVEGLTQEYPWITPPDRRTVLHAFGQGELPSQREMQTSGCPQLVPCACGQLKYRSSVRCVQCQRADIDAVPRRPQCACGRFTAGGRTVCQSCRNAKRRMGRSAA